MAIVIFSTYNIFFSAILFAPSYIVYEYMQIYLALASEPTVGSAILYIIMHTLHFGSKSEELHPGTCVLFIISGYLSRKITPRCFGG